MQNENVRIANPFVEHVLICRLQRPASRFARITVAPRENVAFHSLRIVVVPRLFHEKTVNTFLRIQQLQQDATNGI
jgi:hypothetical protein